MSDIIVYEISPDKSVIEESDHYSQSNPRRFDSINPPNLFDRETPQQFQQTMEYTPVEKKQYPVSFKQEGSIRRQINQWSTHQSLKENFNSIQERYRCTSLNQGISKTKTHSLQRKDSKHQKAQPTKETLNTSNIDRITNQSKSQDLIELDLPALIQQIALKRKKSSKVSMGCIIKQAGQKAEGTIARQPGKILNQRPIKSISIGCRK